MVQTGGASQFIPADSVIFAVGQRSVSSEPLRQAAPRLFHVLGDARKPGQVKEAVHAGFYLAMDR